VKHKIISENGSSSRAVPNTSQREPMRTKGSGRTICSGVENRPGRGIEEEERVAGYRPATVEVEALLLGSRPARSPFRCTMRNRHRAAFPHEPSSSRAARRPRLA